MKSLFSLIFLPILFTVTLSAPAERSDHLRHRTSFRHGRPFLGHGSSLQILAGFTNRPPNFAFTPVRSMRNFVHAEYGTSPHLEISDFRFLATLSKLDFEDEVVDAEDFWEGDTGAVFHSQHETHETRHVTILITDSLMWAFKKKGVSQDTIPQYVCQNMHITDPASGDQYRLVPDNSPEKYMLADSNVFAINLMLK